MSPPILYSFWRSSCSWRVRIALHLKNVDYELRPIDIFKNKVNLDDDYKKINPIQKVPVLLIDDLKLIESLNIINYLEENYKDGHELLPQDKVNRAKVREISEMIVSGIQPLQNIGLKQSVALSDEKAFTKFSHFWIKKGLSALETITKKSAGDYCVGNTLSMADLCLFPQMYNAKKFKCDISSYPTLERICTKLEREPAFFLTHPDTQPDCPPRKS